MDSLTFSEIVEIIGPTRALFVLAVFLLYRLVRNQSRQFRAEHGYKVTVDDPAFRRWLNKSFKIIWEGRWMMLIVMVITFGLVVVWNMQANTHILRIEVMLTADSSSISPESQSVGFIDPSKYQQLLSSGWLTANLVDSMGTREELQRIFGGKSREDVMETLRKNSTIEITSLNTNNTLFEVRIPDLVSSDSLQNIPEVYRQTIERLPLLGIDHTRSYTAQLVYWSLPSALSLQTRRLSLLLSPLVGLLLGLLIVYISRALKDSIRSVGDLQERKIPVIGIIPDFQTITKRDFSGQEYVLVEEREVSMGLHTLLSPLSSIAEAYRNLRTRITAGNPDKVIKTLMLTSTGYKDGCTTTVINLALVLAQASRRVMVVDADLRRPHAHKVLGLPGKPGLTEILFNKLTFSAEEFYTGFDGFYLLPAGSQVPNPVEVLGSRRMSELVEMLQESFDIVAAVDSQARVIF